MDRKQESDLLNFCVAQREDFDPSAWKLFSAVLPLELAATARYLSGVSWYGHTAKLKIVADTLSPLSFPVLAQKTGFQASRFAGLLKAHLRHASRTVSP